MEIILLLGKEDGSTVLLGDLGDALGVTEPVGLDTLGSDTGSLESLAHDVGTVLGEYPVAVGGTGFLVSEAAEDSLELRILVEFLEEVVDLVALTAADVILANLEVDDVLGLGFLGCCESCIAGGLVCCLCCGLSLFLGLLVSGDLVSKVLAGVCDCVVESLGAGLDGVNVLVGDSLLESVDSVVDGCYILREEVVLCESLLGVLDSLLGCCDSVGESLVGCCLCCCCLCCCCGGGGRSCLSCLLGTCCLTEVELEAEEGGVLPVDVGAEDGAVALLGVSWV